MKIQLIKLSFGVATLLLTLGTTSLQAQNLIQNGSFEEMDSVTKNTSKWKTGTLANWSGEVKLLTNKAGKKATDGNRKLVLDRSNETKADILLQEVNFEVDGKYKISFDAYGLKTNSSHLQVMLDGKIVKRIEPTKAWENYVVEFSSTAGTHTIGFKEIKDQSNGKGAILDNVELSLVKDTVVIDTTTNTNTPTTTSNNQTLFNNLTQGEEFTYAVETSSSKKSFSLLNAAEGMTINPRTGVISWTPLSPQSRIVEVKNTNKVIESIAFTVLDSDYSANANWIFVSPNGSNSNAGTHDAPLANLGELCGKSGKVLAGKTIYYRGGEYNNPDFGKGDQSVGHASLPAMTCSGTASKPLLITAWGNEKAKIKFDSAYGVQLAGNHLRFENFEIEGISQDISHDDVVKRWWTASNYYNGQGINVQGFNVIVRDNVIHDIPGAGINNKGNAIVDNLIIDNNIIFNANWWSTGGTTALGIVGANSSDSAKKLPNSKKGIEITNNLVFSSESRIFSHVFSKGFSHLIIDEGSSMLLKRDKGSKVGTFDKGFLIENNYFLFNGKGVSLRWDGIEMKNNTFYNNGTTIKGSGGGIRSSQGTNMVINNNAIFTQENATLNAVDFAQKNVSVIECTNNRYYTLDSKKSLKHPQICEINANGGNAFVENMFADAEQNDFTVSDDNSIGASSASMTKHKAKMRELGYAIAPTNYKREINGTLYKVNTVEYYQAQIDLIVQQAEAYGSVTVEEAQTTKKHEYILTFNGDRPEGVSRVYRLKLDSF